MKKQYSLLHLSLIPALLLVFCLFSAGLPDETSAKKERVRMKMYYFKTASGDRRIDIALTAGSGKSMHGVREGEVTLMAVVGDSTFNLATITTDTLGQVSLYLAEDYVLPLDEDGKVVLEAAYDGNDKYRSASNDIEVMDLNLKVLFEVEDSVKYLRIEATRPDIEGNMVPVEELDVMIGVQRLYSVLPLDDIETDEDGFAELEFPNDIPGDADGMITIVAKVDDSDLFGTVAVKAAAAWGTDVSFAIHPLPRQLFTDEAPLWMIAAVFIILLGAWYHFFLSISKLIKMRKAGSDS
jgi:hypothetical protein